MEENIALQEVVRGQHAKFVKHVIQIEKNLLRQKNK
tara:strand:- start:378 stop:485 length:108 start_codon:yes stop_codon:yes gene_type:complete